MTAYTYPNPNDASHGIDTYVDSSAATTNNGTATTIRAGAAGASGKVFSHLLFNQLRDAVLGIPTSETCVGGSATLTLFPGQTFVAAHIFELMEGLAANDGWGETTATYDTKDGTNPWAGNATQHGGAVAGTDINATVMATGTSAGGESTTNNTPIVLTFTSAGLAMLDNYRIGASRDLHLVLRGDTTAGQTWGSNSFRSSDTATAGLRPLLTINTVSALTAIGTTRVVSWGVRTKVAATRAASWNVRTVVTRARQMLYSVRTRASVTRGVLYTVRATVQRTRQLLYAVRAHVTPTRALLWNARATVTRTRVVSYAVRARATQTRTLNYAVRTRVTITRVVQWHVRTLVSASTRTLLWTVRRAMGPSARVVTWNVRAHATMTRAAAWGVLTRVGTVSRTLSWSVRGSAGVTRALSWAARAHATAERVLRWTVAVHPQPRHITLTILPRRTDVTLVTRSTAVDVAPERIAVEVDP